MLVSNSHSFKAYKRHEATSFEGEKPTWDWKRNMAGAAMHLTRKPSRVICLSGTPAPDLQRDLYAQLDNCDPWGWGSFRVWATRYAGGVEGTYGFESEGASNEEELNYRKSFVVHYIAQSEIDAEIPKLDRVLVRLEPKDLDAVSIAKSELDSAAARGHSALLELQLGIAAAMKRSYVVSRVEKALEEGRKVCVFTGRKRDADRLYARIKEVAERLSTPERTVFHGLAHGDSTELEMRAVLDGYISAPSHAVAIGTLDAWGEAIDGLQKGTTLALIVMLPYSYGKIRQGEGRFTRLEADKVTLENGVTIEYVIAKGTVDETIFDLVLRKVEMGAKVLGDEDLRKLSQDLLGTDEENDAMIEALAARILSTFDASIDTDELKVDFSPDAERLRRAGDDSVEDNFVEDARGDDLDVE